MSTVNPTLYLKTLFNILSGIVDLTNMDKSQKEKLAKNITGRYLQKYNSRISQLPDKSADEMTQIALAELENIVKEMISVVNRTLNEEAKKRFNKQVNFLLSKALVSR